ncbi:unnamed protein product [Sphenostylis stenocarpa]|uniref:Acetyltransferase n=1 Tax=Sphenostylis stenocarpa TaxID=92480 RepID=A0AA86SV61_9FABA|nr:unnamed protein product [Sphenostylis stenocarpa]
MVTPLVRRISECFVKPHGSTQVSNQICDLTPWDFAMMSMHYIQKGLLFKKPATLVDQRHFIENLLEKLRHSFSHSLPFLSFGWPPSDILSPVDVPPIVHSFFDHHRAVNYDGHTMPLLSIQVTELVDGVFIGCSMNHAVGDGTSYWNFFNTWSQIFQAQTQANEYMTLQCTTFHVE